MLLGDDLDLTSRGADQAPKPGKVANPTVLPYRISGCVLTCTSRVFAYKSLRTASNGDPATINSRDAVGRLGQVGGARGALSIRLLHDPQRLSHSHTA